MKYLLKNLNVYRESAFQKADILIDDGIVAAMGQELRVGGGVAVFDFNGAHAIPGLIDPHVHLREPGYEYKETIRTGTLAAARGGYSAVCSMPNLKPVPDNMANLKRQLDVIKRDAAVMVRPYGAITRSERGEELSDMEAMAPYVAGFSDDGRGVQSEDMMRRAMERARELNLPIVAHAEDESLLKKGWAVHDGGYARAHGLVGNPSESEWRQVERDLELVRETGCAYHVCHVSAKETVGLVRLAKGEGLDVTCETAPHYLTLTDADLQDSGRFRMNPPIRSAEDRDALIEGVCDGTVDMIATDHAPHTKEEKAGGLAHSLNGIVGLECAFPVLYTKLVLGRITSLERLIEMMSAAPARRFGLPGGAIRPGEPANIAVFDLDREFAIDPAEFASLGRATPFEGWRVRGRCLMTVSGGKIVWRDDND